MSVQRSRPGNPGVRSGKSVGPDYPENHWDNPINMGIDSHYGSEDHKTIHSPTANTFEGGGIPLHDNYNELWKGK